jgi:hypothetical protein
MTMDRTRRDRIAQWAFDSRPVLGRFHLWLEDVDERWISGGPEKGLSFAGPALEKALIAGSAVTALGTRLFGRWGEAKGQDKTTTNRIKKDADAASAYAMSEALWYLTRNLPENHAIMVCLGEGLMPKGGETPDMGSNPLLGFGRIYARPQIAKFLERKVHRLINDPTYNWDMFWREIQISRVTVWGAAVDTLENTSRFARGNPTGPLTVLHLFDQPLKVVKPYEGYVGNLALPKEVVNHAAEASILLDYLAPRALVMQAIRTTYPDIEPERVHVWTLGGPTRVPRIGKLWDEWKSVGAHVIEDGWAFPGGAKTFTESGTYAPTYCVGLFSDPEGKRHLFLADGYAATAEAIQAASLDPVLGNVTSMCLFTSKFDISYDKERHVIHLDPDAPDFPAKLAAAIGNEVSEKDVAEYRSILKDAREAGMPVNSRTNTVDDFFPKKEWGVLALSGVMLPDPYTGIPGVEEVSPNVYRVTTRASSANGILEVVLTLRLMESVDESRLVFSPLLDRFYRGQDYKTRAVKVSDSGRIRNELQTLCSESLEHFGENCMRIHFDQIDDAVLAPDKRQLIREVLTWYKETHPIWFSWLDLAG